MFMALLKIQGNKPQVAEYLADHKAWLQRGFDEGVFLVSGNMTGQAGGGILMHGLSADEVQQRLSQDPFVIYDIVSVQVIEITPTKADPRMAFLL